MTGVHAYPEIKAVMKAATRSGTLINGDELPNLTQIVSIIGIWRRQNNQCGSRAGTIAPDLPTAVCNICFRNRPWAWRTKSSQLSLFSGPVTAKINFKPELSDPSATWTAPTLLCLWNEYPSSKKNVVVSFHFMPSSGPRCIQMTYIYSGCPCG